MLDETPVTLEDKKCYLHTEFQALVLILFCERGRRGLRKIAIIFGRIAAYSY
jgi:hypothetical protein